VHTNVEGISPHYFASLGVGFERGRDFSSTDMTAAASGKIQPMIIDQQAMGMLGLDEATAVGSLVEVPGSSDHGQIIGVVHSIELAKDQQPTLYVPLTDFIQPNRDITVNIFTRSRSDLVTVHRILESGLSRTIPAITLGQTSDAENSFPLEYQLLRMQRMFSILTIAITVISAFIGTYAILFWLTVSNLKGTSIRVALGATWLQALEAPLRSLTACGGVSVLLGVGVASLIEGHYGRIVNPIPLVSAVALAVGLYLCAFVIAATQVQLTMRKRSLASALNAE
jgi:hypothetical protein